MNKKYYMIFYPKMKNYETKEYTIAKKTFQNWKKASTFRRKIEFNTGYQCSLVAIHCTDSGIFRTIQSEIQNSK